MTQNGPASTWLKLPTFASLLNQKVVIQSSTSDYIAVDQYFFNECLRPFIHRIQFDEQCTCKSIRREAGHHAEGSERCEGAFLRFGYFEHRLPYRIEVQEDWYLEQYPDIKKAIKQREFKSARNISRSAGFVKAEFRIHILI